MIPERRITLLVYLYTMGVAGAIIQIAGGYWDVSWHILRLVETFITPPHTILYTGVTLTLMASLAGFFLRMKSLGRREYQEEKSLLTGLHISLLGGTFQVLAGGLDSWWHSNFGFDPFLFTPPHSLLILGIIFNGLGMAVGSIRLLHTHGPRAELRLPWHSSKWLELLVILALATLWLDLNTLVYLVTDVQGIAYTFQLSPSIERTVLAVAFPLALVTLTVTGTLTLLMTKRVVGWKGAATFVAVISAGISATTNLSFRAFVMAETKQGSTITSFIPLYISFLLPVLIYDLLVGGTEGRLRLFLASALIGPFASYLDGWFSLILWTQSPFLVPVLMGPMLISGLLSGPLVGRFARTSIQSFIPASQKE